MAMEISGDNNQFGVRNTQFIESTVVNNNINLTIINMNCSECHQHQSLEGVPISQGNIHHVIKCLQEIAASGDQPTRQMAAGHTTRSTDEEANENQSELATPAKIEVVQKRRVKERRPDQEARASLFPAITESLRLLDLWGDRVNPGNAVEIHGVVSLYVGYGYTVWYDDQSGTVVQGKLDMKRPFYKLIPYNPYKIKVYSTELRVQRALQEVGNECPLRGGGGLDFVTWTYTGLSWKESLLGGFFIRLY